MEPARKFMGGALTSIVLGKSFADMLEMPEKTDLFVVGMGVFYKPFAYMNRHFASHFFYTSLGMRTITNLTISYNALQKRPEKSVIGDAFLAIVAAFAVEEVAALYIPREIAIVIGDVSAGLIANL